MDGQIWLFVSRLSERSDGEEGMRTCRKPSRPCLEWPGPESLVEAQHLRTRMLWRWAAEAISHLLHLATSRVRESRIRESGERGVT
jgi:hypothetical protein